MYIVCADLEGIFVPEVWINVAEKTGIKELRLTTRDISNYDVLMKKRLSILDENGLKLEENINEITLHSLLQKYENELDELQTERSRQENALDNIYSFNMY